MIHCKDGSAHQWRVVREITATETFNVKRLDVYQVDLGDVDITNRPLPEDGDLYPTTFGSGDLDIDDVTSERLECGLCGHVVASQRLGEISFE